MIGDMNAKVGREEIYRHITGIYSKHEESTGNGKRLIAFASERNMRIMSTCFQRKDFYKGTWISPDDNTSNQIDHVVFERKYARAVKKGISQRGAVS